MKKILIMAVAVIMFACFPFVSEAVSLSDLERPGGELPSMIVNFSSTAQIKGEAIVEASYIAKQNEKLELYFKKSSDVNFQKIDTYAQGQSTPENSERSLYLYHVKNLESGVEYLFEIRLLDVNGSDIVTRDTTVITPKCDLEINNATPRHITDNATLHLHGCGFGDNYLAPYGGDTYLYFMKGNHEQIVNNINPVDWSNEHIAFRLDPSLHESMTRGDITMKVEQVYFDANGQPQVFSSVTYNGQSEYLQNKNQVRRTVESGYQGEEYLHLYNALAFRYGVTAPRDIDAEQAEAAAFRERMRTKLGRDISVDALWFLNLFYARHYGGYSDEDIELEVNYGPCRVHVTIPQSAWSKTPEYQQCEPGEF